MAGKTILQRFDKTPVRNQATVLFVGAKGTGKHRVAKTLLGINNNTNKDLSLQIHTATLLPLPEERECTRPRIDYVVFFIDMTNRVSFQVVKDSVKYISVDYFLGRCCFVATKVGSEIFQNVSIHEVTSLADAYDSPLVCADLEVEEDQSPLAKKLLCSLEIACGLRSDVTPLFLDTTRHSLVFENS